MSAAGAELRAGRGAFAQVCSGSSKVPAISSDRHPSADAPRRTNERVGMTEVFSPSDDAAVARSIQDDLARAGETPADLATIDPALIAGAQISDGFANALDSSWSMWQ